MGFGAASGSAKFTGAKRSWTSPSFVSTSKLVSAASVITSRATGSDSKRRASTRTDRISPLAKRCDFTPAPIFSPAQSTTTEKGFRCVVALKFGGPLPKIRSWVPDTRRTARSSALGRASASPPAKSTPRIRENARTAVKLTPERHPAKPEDPAEGAAPEGCVTAGEHPEGRAFSDIVNLLYHGLSDI